MVRLVLFRIYRMEILKRSVRWFQRSTENQPKKPQKRNKLVIQIHYFYASTEFATAVLTALCYHVWRRHTAAVQRCRSRGCRGWPPPDFDKSVNPISTRGTDYAHHITTWPPPIRRFSDLPTSSVQRTVSRLFQPRRPCAFGDSYIELLVYF